VRSGAVVARPIASYVKKLITIRRCCCRRARDPLLASALNHSALAHDLDSHHAEAILNRNFDQNDGWDGKVRPISQTEMKGRR